MHPIVRNSRQALVTYIAAGFLCIFPAYVARAQEDAVPLTLKSLQSYWRDNPTEDPQAYIEEVVARRKVAFLPTYSVRTILRNSRVHRAVVESLAKYPASGEEFRFLVWWFAPGTPPVSLPALKRLANEIDAELRQKENELRAVFPYHQKVSAGVAEGYGPKPHQPGGRPVRPYMHVTGKIERDGARWKATVLLKYISDAEPEPVLIRVAPVTGLSLDESGVREAARRIVTAIHEALRVELTKPTP